MSAPTLPVQPTVGPLRDEQTSLTRDRIIRAVAELAATAHPTAFSVPAVAELAGVSVRTVYRYFPTKEDLLDALSELGGRAATHLLDEGPVSMDEYLDHLPQLWRDLLANRAVVQSQHQSPIGRESRARRTGLRRGKVDEAVRAAHPDLTDAERERLVHGVLLVGSSVALFELVDNLGLDIDDASDLATWATRALIDAARSH